MAGSPEIEGDALRSPLLFLLLLYQKTTFFSISPFRFLNKKALFPMKQAFSLLSTYLPEVISRRDRVPDDVKHPNTRCF